MYAAGGRLGSAKHQSALCAFVVFCSTTFLRLLEHYVFLYRNRKNVINSQTLCEIPP
jgi:hypothetical protein